MCFIFLSIFKKVIKKLLTFCYWIKGLIFCSRVVEAEELSRKLNDTINPDTGEFFRTISLHGSASEDERQSAFERLAMEESEATEEMQPLDYIISVELLNEGVDIVEVNQVIMLRPTQSPIIFIQQLGRGLRKAAGKEYVVILDFIGNYSNNFMIPIALSGDRSYNPDNIRKYVISGNSTIPGASTIHFDAVSKEKIFRSIDNIRGMKAIIRESYGILKDRLGRIPYLMDFYQSGEVDPLVIISEYKTYYDFLCKVEPDLYVDRFTEQERLTLEYVSRTLLSGIRPYDLELLKEISEAECVSEDDFTRELEEIYQYASPESVESSISVLEGHFVTKEAEYDKYRNIEILEKDSTGLIRRMSSYSKRLQKIEFWKQMADIVQVGLQRYRDHYYKTSQLENSFVLYEKYTRRDVCLLMNCERDYSSTMYGKYLIGDDVFIFVTYHKVGADSDDLQYVEGKPDYADAFADNLIFHWDSQIGRGPDSGYMKEVLDAKRKHLFVKKSDAEKSFYYMGTFDILDYQGATKIDNSGRQKDITKVTMRMHRAVREDLLRYLESNLEQEEEKK